jgi:hypothetical protein
VHDACDLATKSAVHADLTVQEIERLHYLLGALRASLKLCEYGDVGAFTSDLRSAFFASLASMATSAYAIASHITATGRGVL